MSEAIPTQRIPTIDVAKGVGILLVVLGHNAVFREHMHSAYEAIYLFHMPLFFFLSGVTFRVAEPATAFRKRFRSLLVPYFAMALLAVAFDALTGDPAAALDEIGGVLYGTGSTLRFTPLWFLPCLFIVSMSATLLLRGRSQVRAAVAIAILGGVIGVWTLTSSRFGLPPFQDATGRPLGLPWSLDLLPFVLSLFVLGVLFARARFVRDCPAAWLVVSGGIGMLVLLASHGASLDLNYRRMTNPLAVILAMAAGVAAVLALSARIARYAPAARLFSYLGSASLVLLMLHSPVQRRVLERLAPWVTNGPLLAFGGTIVTVALICIIDVGALRRIPALGWVCYPRRAPATAV